ncbi:MAG: hypothetical protein PHN19_05160 [Patescibacteria group bacterium]|nr:hypothetical protein [Patescibacteria group bacterium]
MYRTIMAILVLFLVGCGAHAPKSATAPSTVHLQYFAGETMVTFMGSSYMPENEVALENSAHEAVFALLRAKMTEMNGSLMEVYCKKGKVVKKDSDNTIYIVVPYGATVIVPAGTPTQRLAQLSRL